MSLLALRTRIPARWLAGPVLGLAVLTGSIAFSPESSAQNQPPGAPPGPPGAASECKNGGWKRFTNPSFKNQGECVSFVEQQRR